MKKKKKKDIWRVRNLSKRHTYPGIWTFKGKRSGGYGSIESFYSRERVTIGETRSPSIRLIYFKTRQICFLYFSKDGSVGGTDEEITRISCRLTCGIFFFFFGVVEKNFQFQITLK